MFERLWRRRSRRGGAADPAARACRIRARLETLDDEYLELLLDDRVPGRKHRLDAVGGAQEDLRAELAWIEGP